MSGLLADLYSAGDRMKRKLGGLLSDPMGTIALGSTRMAEDTNALTRLVSEAGYMPNTVNRSDQSVLVSERQKALARALLADKGAEMGMAAATVWHGSPHKFDKFDSSKIGTGEGAQAYGHGLYLAESPKVAANYQRQLSGIDPAYKAAGNVRDMGEQAKRLFPGDKARQDAWHVLAQMHDWTDPVELAKWAKSVAYTPESAAVMDDVIAKIYNPGSLYKVDLPDNAIARMLDWDKPISEQPQAVRDALAKLPKGWATGSGGQRQFIDPAMSRKTGGGLLEELQMLRRGQPEELLKQAGVPGIRYLDGGSRGAGQGSSNYVIFPQNEGLLTILERNGVPIK